MLFQIVIICFFIFSAFSTVLSQLPLWDKRRNSCFILWMVKICNWFPFSSTQKVFLFIFYSTDWMKMHPSCSECHCFQQLYTQELPRNCSCPAIGAQPWTPGDMEVSNCRFTQQQSSARVPCMASCMSPCILRCCLQVHIQQKSKHTQGYVWFIYSKRANILKLPSFLQRDLLQTDGQSASTWSSTR